MKLFFCTLFDSNYLSRGLAMYESLSIHCRNFHLYIFPFDDKCYAVLQKLNLPNVTLISLKEFEDDKLLAVKPARSRAEYCWTCTSSTILYVLQKFNTPHCTYLDADLCFYQNPGVLVDEMGNKSVLITEHRYTRKYDKSKISGKYCVQFITFRNDKTGLQVLQWWRNACLDWCYNRIENGKFGDQKYLDDWTTRFEGVHELQHRGGGVALWNVQQYEIGLPAEKIVFTEKKSGEKFDLIFYHYHYLRFYNNGMVDLGRYVLPKRMKELLYLPYLRQLEKMKMKVRQVDNSFDPNGPVLPRRDWLTPLRFLWRVVRNEYNIYSKKKLITPD